jgi:hypothetical protein
MAARRGQRSTGRAGSDHRHYRVALRESALRARGVTLPSIYVEAARLDCNNYP